MYLRNTNKIHDIYWKKETCFYKLTKNDGRRPEPLNDFINAACCTQLSFPEDMIIVIAEQSCHDLPSSTPHWSRVATPSEAKALLQSLYKRKWISLAVLRYSDPTLVALTDSVCVWSIAKALVKLSNDSCRVCDEHCAFSHRASSWTPQPIHTLIEN